MIVYFDTSALIKRYLTEADSPAVESVWNQATLIGASEILYPEMAATFARKRREVPENAILIGNAEANFRADWRSFQKIPVGEEIHRRVDDLLTRHALRGADSIHLASALLFRDLVADVVTFACADSALLGAARAQGLRTAP